MLCHPHPTNIQELQGFLGTVNFYCRFMPAAARMLRPLTDTLQGGPAAKAAVPWTAEMVAVFAACKQVASLAHPSLGMEIGLMVDASSCPVCAVLQQGHQRWPCGNC